MALENQMDMFQNSDRDIGLLQEGGEVEQQSGNVVPTGGTTEGVADNVDANLSSGEMIIPAEVVRYHGVEEFMKMRDEAMMGYKKMEAMGQFGNPDEAQIPNDSMFNPGGMPFSVIDLEYIDEEEEEAPKQYQVGGYVPSTYYLPQQGTQPTIPTSQNMTYSINPTTGQPLATPTQPGSNVTTQAPPPLAPQMGTPAVISTPTSQTTTTLSGISTGETGQQAPVPGTSAPVGPPPALPGFGEATGGVTDQYYFINEDGNVITIPVLNGKQIYPEPEGYRRFDPNAEERPDVEGRREEDSQEARAKRRAEIRAEIAREREEREREQARIDREEGAGGPGPSIGGDWSDPDANVSEAYGGDFGATGGETGTGTTSGAATSGQAFSGPSPASGQPGGPAGGVSGTAADAAASGAAAAAAASAEAAADAASYGGGAYGGGSIGEAGMGMGVDAGPSAGSGDPGGVGTGSGTGVGVGDAWQRGGLVQRNLQKGGLMRPPTNPTPNQRILPIGPATPTPTISTGTLNPRRQRRQGGTDPVGDIASTTEGVPDNPDLETAFSQISDLMQGGLLGIAFNTFGPLFSGQTSQPPAPPAYTDPAYSDPEAAFDFDITPSTEDTDYSGIAPPGSEAEASFGISTGEQAPGDIPGLDFQSDTAFGETTSDEPGMEAAPSFGISTGEQAPGDIPGLEADTDVDTTGTGGYGTPDVGEGHTFSGAELAGMDMAAAIGQAQAAADVDIGMASDIAAMGKGEMSSAESAAEAGFDFSGAATAGAPSSQGSEADHGPPGSGDGDPDGPGTVICTELLRQGLMSKELYQAAHEYEPFSQTSYAGYHYWAKPVVKLMHKNKTVTNFFRPLATAWCIEMAHHINPDKCTKRSFLGKCIRSLEPVHYLLGLIVEKKALSTEGDKIHG